MINETHRLANDLRAGVAEHDFSATIPAHDGAVKGTAEDGVVGGVDDGGEEGEILLGFGSEEVTLFASDFMSHRRNLPETD